MSRISELRAVRINDPRAVYLPQLGLQLCEALSEGARVVVRQGLQRLLVDLARVRDPETRGSSVYVDLVHLRLFLLGDGCVRIVTYNFTSSHWHQFTVYK